MKLLKKILYWTVFIPGCLWIMKSQKGEANNSSKLTWDDVGEIRRLYATGKFKTWTELGKMFSVNYSTIRDVVLKNTWKD